MWSPTENLNSLISDVCIVIFSICFSITSSKNAIPQIINILRKEGFFLMNYDIIHLSNMVLNSKHKNILLIHVLEF